MIPVQVDPATGARVVLVEPPDGVTPAEAAGLSSGPHPLLQMLGQIFPCLKPAEPPPAPCVFLNPIPPAHRRFRPVEIRQPDFDNADDGSVDINTSSYLSAKTLTALKTKLALSEINDYVIDLKRAVSHPRGTEVAAPHVLCVTLPRDLGTRPATSSCSVPGSLL